MSESDDYYEIMGVPKSANRDDLKRAFKNRALIHHPDKGGDPEKFKELVRAYEFLCDPEKRRRHDERYDEDDGLEEEIIGGGDSSMHGDVSPTSSSSLIVSSSSSSEEHSSEGGEDLEYEIEVSLEDLYLGTIVKYPLTRRELCEMCNGEGTKSGVLPRKCLYCKGSGLVLIMSTRHYRESRICQECIGTGKKINDEDRCPQCKGEKFLEEERVFEIHIQKGMQHGQKITFPLEPDEAHATSIGNLTFVLCQKEHPKFKRKGRDNLFVEHTLSVFEALCGFKFVLPHLDGRKLLIKSQPGEVVKPGSYKAVDKEGMPTLKNHSMKGNLYIHFQVQFPDSLSPDLVKSLAQVFPPRPESKITDTELAECDETTLRDVESEDEMQRRMTLEDEDEDEDEQMQGD